MIGVAMAMTGCGGVVVVEESSKSDYDLCVEKREVGGVAPEVAALDCLLLADESAAQNE